MRDPSNLAPVDISLGSARKVASAYLLDSSSGDERVPVALFLHCLEQRRRLSTAAGWLTRLMKSEIFLYLP